jgi:hypothetical protein
MGMASGDQYKKMQAVIRGHMRIHQRLNIARRDIT